MVELHLSCVVHFLLANEFSWVRLSLFSKWIHQKKRRWTHSTAVISFLQFYQTKRLKSKLVQGNFKGWFSISCNTTTKVVCHLLVYHISKFLLQLLDSWIIILPWLIPILAYLDCLRFLIFLNPINSYHFFPRLIFIDILY